MDSGQVEAVEEMVVSVQLETARRADLLPELGMEQDGHVMNYGIPVYA